MDQGTHPGDDQQEKHRESVDLKGKGDVHLPDLDEVEQLHDLRLKISRPYLTEDEQAHHKGRQHGAHGDDRYQRAGQQVPAESVQQKACQRKEGDQIDQFAHIRFSYA